MESIALNRIASGLKQNSLFKEPSQHVCFFCSYMCQSKEVFTAHLIDSHPELIFCCDICNTYLPNKQLLTHMTNHANDSLKYNSNTNNRYELKSQKYQKVLDSYEGIKCDTNSAQVFNCVQCEQNFTSKRVLNNHKLSLHGEGLRSFTCQDCGKTFKTDSTLYTHRKLHKDSKPFECDQCERSFRLKHHLKTHMVQHLKAYQTQIYECEFCRKRFAALDNLRKHKKVHEITLRDIVCHICGTKLKQKRYLQAHMKKVHLRADK